MHRLLLLLAVFGLTACASAGDRVPSLAAEFRAIRVQQGHFSGGEWNDAVDRFGGRKHEVMIELGRALADGKRTRAEVIALLGEPDAVLRPTDAMFRQSYDGRDPQVRELLVYHWRGWHDFLYFASDGTRVHGADWWFAWD